MDSQPELVNLTLSDDDESEDLELLSLAERIQMKEKKSDTQKNSNLLTKRSLITLKEEKEETCAIENPKVLTDSDNEELPDLANILGVKPIFRISGSEEDSEEILLPVPKPAKKPRVRKNDVDNEKENAKIEKLKLREEKKQEKELAKALKASEKEMQKSLKPDECLKGMKVIVDQSIIFENESEDIFSSLDESNIKYNVEENPVNLSVLWCRTIVDCAVENNQVVKSKKEEVERNLVLVLPCDTFIKMVHAFLQKTKGKFDSGTTLSEYVCNVKAIYPSVDITCVIVGLEKYQRSIKENDLCGSELKKLVKQASKSVIEEAVIEVQVQASVNFHFLNNMREFGDLLARFTKAIAEAPQRQEKFRQKCSAFSWYADADSSCPVKLGKDGSECLKLWRQQIQQFNSVGSEVAEAIVSRYPSLQQLIKAYEECTSTKEAEKLLQNIVVRRNYGPLGTQRRIGPELSYKIYLFFTSRDGNQIIQR